MDVADGTSVPAVSLTTVGGDDVTDRGSNVARHTPEGILAAADGAQRSTNWKGSME